VTLPVAAGSHRYGSWRPDDVLAALADPTRRSLLGELARCGEATASSLARNLPITRQAVMKHLAVLSQAGLVTGRRSGREVRFAAQPAAMMSTAQWMAGLAAEWEVRLGALKRIAESDLDPLAGPLAGPPAGPPAGPSALPE
jgi:DNA-binding transcriptional ArsR family regulator